eukprot:CAMPEP_0171592020 /NCGR_PEP_ID=MMETSP0961-20121227/16593_1 /TAXON_ID=87120 /ORGANISM="Aurantiochytrium limacinum, Strain ATCCMYA-1381" /LENGTH=35 /DNA_ID= /DNA_START= /DNA_END= /DNA_ORIENTATION=
MSQAWPIPALASLAVSRAAADAELAICELRPSAQA